MSGTNFSNNCDTMASNRVSQKMKSVDCSSVDLSILMRNLSTDLDFLKLPFMLLFCVPDLQ